MAVVLASSVNAATITVDLEGDGDYEDLQSAIDAAVEADTVVVRPGIYLIGAPLTFRGKAITVRAEAGPGQTAIRRSEPAVEQEGGMVVVFQDGEDERSILDGFTVAGHVEDLEPLQGVFRETVGGGILCTGRVQPTLRDCVIAGHGAQDGGGVACVDGAAPRFSRCTVRWNIALGGGGVFVQASSPLFEDCSISANVAEMPDTGGGGVLCIGPGSPRFVRCRIAGNFGGCGSAVHVDDASPVFENCTIFGHPVFALEVGCGVCDEPIFVNCTISENEEDGPVCHRFKPAHFLNCILSSHWESGWNPWRDNPINLSDKNPLFAGEGIIDFGRWSTVTSAGKTIRVPDFVVEEPDFHLRPDSPAIDAGTADGAPGTDIEEIVRPRCGGIDLGAYEFSDCAVLVKLFRRGDCNDSGDVDIADAVCILSWLFSGGAAPGAGCVAIANTNGDDRTDVSDPVHLLNHLFLGGPDPAAPYPECGPGRLPADENLCATPPSSCRN